MIKLLQGIQLWSGWPWCLTSPRMASWNGPQCVLPVHQKLKGFMTWGQNRPTEKALKGQNFTDISRWRAAASTSSWIVWCGSEVFWRSLPNAQPSWLRQLESHQFSNQCPLPLWQKILVGFPLQQALLTFSLFSNIKPFMSTKIPSGPACAEERNVHQVRFYLIFLA